MMKPDFKDRLKLESHEPGPRAKCLCGSGKKFKNCCKNEYPKQEFNAHQSLQDGNFRKALRETRAHITWYRLAHYAHTVPAQEFMSDQVISLMEIDIDALHELLELLLYCYQRNDIIDQFQTVLVEMEQAIQHEGWLEKFDHLSCVYSHIYCRDLTATKVVLDKYEWQLIDDPDFLTIFLDVYSNELNYVDTIAICESIISRTEKPVVRFQYEVCKGIQYWLLGDEERGIELVLAAVKTFEEIPIDDRSSYGQMQLGMALSHLGCLKNSQDYTHRALDLCSAELESGSYSDIGLARIWFDIGECHRHLGQLSESLDAYNESYMLENSEITRVFIARAEIGVSNIDHGRKLLERIDVNLLTPANFCDFAVTSCELAFKSGNPKDTASALARLKVVEIRDPVFQELITGLFVKLYEQEQDDDNGSETQSALAKLNRYLTLKPSFLGVGIDFNAILEDFLRKSDS